MFTRYDVALSDSEIIIICKMSPVALILTLASHFVRYLRKQLGVSLKEVVYYEIPKSPIPDKR
jgi:hypothetical protein